MGDTGDTFAASAAPRAGGKPHCSPAPDFEGVWVTPKANSGSSTKEISHGGWDVDF